jgi:hypothetical protein
MPTTHGRPHLKGVHEMIARKKNFADISTVADIEAALAEYDVATLEASLATAQQRRTDLLLTGTDPEILAAEDEATRARLALDRAVAAVAELNRRLEETREAEAFAAAKKRRDDADAAVDKVAARIKEEYAAHAQAISNLVAEAKAADAGARSINSEIWENASELAPIIAVHGRIGWDAIYYNPPEFGDAISLPIVGEFGGVGKRLMAGEVGYAPYEIGAAPE